MKNNFESFVSGLFSFFFTINIVSQITNNKPIMIIISAIASGIIVIDFGNNFYIDKAREFIFAVGISTFIFALGVGYYTYQGSLPNNDLAVYAAQASGHLAIRVYTITSAVAVILLQTYSSVSTPRTFKKTSGT